MRDCPISVVAPAQMLRDRKTGSPGAANNRREYLSSTFGWAVDCGNIRSNPAKEVRRITYAHRKLPHLDGSPPVRGSAPNRHKARLALALMLFLGVRRGDLVRLGRQHLQATSFGSFGARHDTNAETFPRGLARPGP
jgi:integrase